MTANRRIVLNTLASYGRSLVAMFMGLFTARWVLAALGKEDFGLFGLVGSIITFVGLLNGIMSAAVSRYYAFAIGEADSMDPEKGRQHLIKWFNAALSIHAFLPAALCIIGYPIGVYAIHHWLVIPVERIPTCIIVFRFALFAAFLNMISVPYVALYAAKQWIAELSFWGVLQTTTCFICAYLLLSWNGDRLVAYAAYMTFIPAAITLIQILRARHCFGVCVIRAHDLFSWPHLKKLFVFASGELFGWVGGAVRDNGMAFLINVNYGVKMNASYGVAQSVSSHTTNLSSAMIGALVPAVSTAEGNGDHGRAERLSFASIKFGTLLVGLFAVPLIVEIDKVLELWLVNPPEHVGMLSCCILVSLLVHKLGWGFHIAILANGKVVTYQMIAGIIGAFGIVIAWILIHCGLGIVGVGVSFVINYAILDVVRAVFARRLCGMSVRHWAFHIVCPIVLSLSVTFLVGQQFAKVMAPSVVRVLLTSLICAMTLSGLTWFLVCDKHERELLLSGVAKIKTKFGAKRH